MSSEFMLPVAPVSSVGSVIFFFSSRRRHTRLQGDWSSDVCSSDLIEPMNIALLLALSLTTPLDTATFAGGCFWTMEHAYDDLPGVISATSGFMGGTTKNPSYMDVVQGNTGHLESVQVVYDPAKVSYETLLWTFWHNIDPFQTDGQACDTGPNYHTAVFVRGAAQRRAASASRQQIIDRFHRDVATQVLTAG